MASYQRERLSCLMEDAERLLKERNVEGSF